MKKETEQFKILEFQDCRMWTHCKKRGYGKWVSNSEIELLFHNKGL